MKKTSALILALVLCFGLCACGDDGDKITVVSKGMSPIINDGDTVFCHSIEDTSELSIGDIIVYWTIMNGQRVAYASRIKNIYDGGGYLIFETQDDNNEYANSLTVHESEIIGEFTNTNPQKAECNHSWRNATCFKPRICDICGATEGGVVSHSWKDATYSAPKTCTICGATEGSKLPPVIAPDDTTAPELISFTLDKTNVKVGDVITFTAEIKDSSTIYYAEFQFKCGADYHNVFLENVGENTYSGTLTITDSFVSGTYSISWISIQDYAGNDADLSSDVAFTVTN
ncbi:MAG: signal peptidase I [Clostridia bacterium]|nr:signal peptidase I [Clostridia bacterium]